MFTGLIENVGMLAGARDVPDGRVLSVQTTTAGELRLGESVAVNGVCLTVTGVAGDAFTADVGPETLRVTTLGQAAAGDPLNLERAMRGDARFGGHFVQGHVDGVGTVADVRAEGDAHWLTIAFPAAAAALLVAKGAVAVDGISLTVAALREGQFDVMIVPFTWQHTNLAVRRRGDSVNLEFDMVGKYVARAAELSGLTRER
ncbi:MAG: riboflavin synthase [Vicinamibacterales bacterium]